MTVAVHAVRWTSVCAILAMSGACTGRVFTSDEDEGEVVKPDEPGAGGRMGAGGNDAANSGLEVTPRRLQRIGNEEFVWSLVDLVGGDEPLRQALAAGMPLETVGEHGFAQPGPLGLVEVERLLAKAKLAAATVGFHSRLNGKPIIACSANVGAGQAETTCATATMKAMAARAYRRPLQDEETADLLRVFSDARATTGATFLTALRASLAAVLTSPSFLYHDENTNTDKPGVAPLRDVALAARLAATFWRSTPDDVLIDLATQGKLHNDDVLAAEVKRMALDPRSERGLMAFFDELLGTGALAGVTRTSADGAWTADRAAALHAELVGLIQDTIITGDAHFETLIMRGLLSKGAVMAAQSKSNEASPIKRGRLIRERFLCDPMPAPPPNVPVLPEAEAQAVSERERFAEHSRNSACSGCHARMDPIGFAFSNYDHLGRKIEGTIDTSGKIVDVDGGTRTFASQGELFEQLSQSPQARQCFATQWVRFVLGRQVTDSDKAGMERLFTGFADGNIKDLFVQVVQSPAFRQEKVEEVAQ